MGNRWASAPLLMDRAGSPAYEPVPRGPVVRDAAPALLRLRQKRRAAPTATTTGSAPRPVRPGPARPTHSRLTSMLGAPITSPHSDDAPGQGPQGAPDSRSWQARRHSRRRLQHPVGPRHLSLILSLALSHSLSLSFSLSFSLSLSLSLSLIFSLFLSFSLLLSLSHSLSLSLLSIIHSLSPKCAGPGLLWPRERRGPTLAAYNDL